MANKFWVGMVVLFFLGCSSEERELFMQFRMTYGDEPLVIAQEYEYPDGRTIQFTRVSFYISDVVAANQQNESDLLNVAMINLTNSHLDLASAEEGYRLALGSVDAESSDRIRFNLGLTPAQNSTVPAEYESGHPMANSGEYWIAWNSFVFAKIEGFVDLDNDGDTETSMALHLGSNEAFRPVDWIEIPGDGGIRFDLDVKKIFESESLYDIESTPNIHSLSQLDQTRFLMDNLQRAIESRN